ncbi:MAG TPA: FAD-binding oxidoreductase, partial [Arthrobacter sp.]|nr:FAD-binding oxidoreductase [Arthrobacter sp.]
GGYGFQTSSGIAELAAALILGEPGAGTGPVSRTADALAATRWSIRR